MTAQFKNILIFTLATSTLGCGIQAGDEQSTAALQKGAVEYVKAELHESGGPHYLVALDIAPGCSSSDTVDPEAAEALADCFFDLSSALFQERGEDLRRLPRRINSLTPKEKDGIQILRLEQLAGELPIKGSEVVLVAQNGRLTSFMGRLFPASAVKAKDLSLPSEGKVRATAEKGTGLRLEARSRYFDTALQTSVTELENLDKAGEVLAWDDIARVEISRTLNVNYFPVQKQTVVGRHDRFWQPVSSQTINVNVDWQPLAGPNDQAFLDYGAAAMDGEPALCRGNGDVNVCNFISDPAYESVPDNATVVFAGFDAVPRDDDGQIMHAYFWNHDLAFFANTTWAAYDASIGWTVPRKLKIVRPTSATTTCNGGVACAFYGAAEHKIVLPMGGSDNFVKTMAHEYGHFIHFMYGHNNGSFEGRSISEGYADQNILRYALFRNIHQGSRPHDNNLGTAAYADDFWAVPNGYDHRVQDNVNMIAYSNGEAVPSPKNGVSDWSYLTYTPWDTSTRCGNQANGGNQYWCGSLIGVTYWELAWNKIRTPYNAAAAGSNILTTSPFTADPASLANIAYTHAIAGLPAGATLSDFFWRVSERYFLAQNAGLISSAERGRVETVLASHCLGWSGAQCGDSTYHKTAWQKLPTVKTKKSSFANGQTEHFIRAEEMPIRNGSVSINSFNTPSDGMGFVALNSADDEICADLNYPSAGTYQFHAAVYAGGVGSDQLRVKIEPAAYSTWDVGNVFGGWFWSHNGPSYFNVTAGVHRTCVKHFENVNVDAILVRKI